MVMPCQSASFVGLAINYKISISISSQDTVNDRHSDVCISCHRNYYMYSEEASSQLL